MQSARAPMCAYMYEKFISIARLRKAADALAVAVAAPSPTDLFCRSGSTVIVARFPTATEKGDFCRWGWGCGG